MSIRYEIGDLVRYETFGGVLRVVVVDEKEDDIKNGRPGFGGRMPGGQSVWGYDHQIVGVDRRDDSKELL